MYKQSQETDSLETRAELAVLRTYVENQTRLEPILLYRASKCKQTKEQGTRSFRSADNATSIVRMRIAE